MKKPAIWWIREMTMNKLRNEYHDACLVSQIQCIASYEDGRYIMDLGDEKLTSSVVKFLKNNSWSYDTMMDDYMLIKREGNKTSLWELVEGRHVNTIVKKFKLDLMERNLIKWEDLNSFSMKSTAPDGTEFVFINMLNGVLRINTDTMEKELIEHDTVFMFSSILQINYDEDATAETWKEYIPQIIPGKNNIRIFLTYLAYCLLTFDFDWDVAVVLHGTGGNGKSTLVKSFATMFEEYSSLKLSALDDTFAKMGLLNKSFWWANESSRVNVNTEDLKNIISGEQIHIPIKNEDPVDIVLNLKVIITLNKLPHLKEYAEKRRFYIIRTPNKFEGEKDDTTLLDRFISELPGLFNLLIEHMQYYFQMGSKLKKGIATRWEHHYELLDDPFRAFCNKYIDFDYDYTDEPIATEEIKAAYNQYARIYKLPEIKDNTEVGQRIAGDGHNRGIYPKSTKTFKTINISENEKKRVRAYRFLKIEEHLLYNEIYNNIEKEKDSNNIDQEEQLTLFELIGKKSTQKQLIDNMVSYLKNRGYEIEEPKMTESKPSNGNMGQLIDNLPSRRMDTTELEELINEHYPNDDSAAIIKQLKNQGVIHRMIDGYQKSME